MKCKGCGAPFDPQLESCPYCGRENTDRLRRKKILTKRQADYEQEKRQLLEASATEIRLRKLTRLVWIMAGLTVLMILVSFGIYMAFENMSSHKSADMDYLQMLREKERWGAMQSYLYDTDIGGTQQEYWQLALFGQKAERLREGRNAFFSLNREEYRLAFLGDSSINAQEREYMDSHFVYTVKRVLSGCAEILRLREEYTGEGWMAERYGPLSEAGEELLSELEAEARVTLAVVFGMTQEEIIWVTEEYDEDDEDANPYIERIREDWLNES